MPLDKIGVQSQADARQGCLRGLEKLACSLAPRNNTYPTVLSEGVWADAQMQKAVISLALEKSAEKIALNKSKKTTPISMLVCEATETLRNVVPPVASTD